MYSRYLLATILLLASNTEAVQVRACQGQELTEAEMKLCSNPQLSELDYLLQKTLGNLAEQDISSDVYVKEQELWVNSVFDRCEGNSCLVEAYENRIEELGGNTPKSKNFLLIEPAVAGSICHSYLELINSISISDVNSCQLPSLVDSEIKELMFPSMKGEQLKAVDKLFYESIYPSLDNWAQVWRERQIGYELGQFRLGESLVRFQVDGPIYRIIRFSNANFRCEGVAKGYEVTSSKTRELRKEWRQMSTENKAEHGKRFGYMHTHLLVDGEKTMLFDASNLVVFKNEIYSINQLSMRNKYSINYWRSKDWIDVSEIKFDSELDKVKKKTVCNYWFND